jgi:CRISPR-associated exonuclease Cas4
LAGKGDVVEFYPDGAVIPVEYKHGPRRVRQHDDVQLCAQALCLEEMLGAPVVSGAIYSLQTHRRRPVVFTQDLRQQTIRLIERIRAMLQDTRRLPPAVADKRCPHCSLIDACLPATIVAARHARLTRHLYSPMDEEAV